MYIKLFQVQLYKRCWNVVKKTSSSLTFGPPVLLCWRFPNLAQTCYMNSTLQGLLTLTPFVQEVHNQQEVLSSRPESRLMRCSTSTHTHTARSLVSLLTKQEGTQTQISLSLSRLPSFLLVPEGLWRSESATSPATRRRRRASWLPLKRLSLSLTQSLRTTVRKFVLFLVTAHSRVARWSSLNQF